MLFFLPCTSLLVAHRVVFLPCSNLMVFVAKEKRSRARGAGSM